MVGASADRAPQTTENVVEDGKVQLEGGNGQAASSASCPVKMHDITGASHCYVGGVSQGIREITTPAGDPAWLVTGYRLAQFLFSHEGLGRSHPEPERAPRYSEATLFGRPWGEIENERSEHARLRRVLAGSFSARRMEMIRPAVKQIVHQLLTDLSLQKPPVDFHEAISFPLPALTISALLGVPARDREQFRHWSDDWTHMMDDSRAREGMSQLRTYIANLVEVKRHRPGRDVISDLLKHETQGDLSVSEVVAIASTLLFAGHETTVAAINKGIILLLSNPQQQSLLWGNPLLTASTVEEILRSRQPLPQDPAHKTVGILRYAHRDLEVDGVVIRKGDMVLISKAEANQDPEAFEMPESFVVSREGTPHLAFGWGPHYCPGAPLARLELSLLFAELPRRFPNLKLAIRVDELERRTPFLTARPVSVPVTW
jgi:cytochrome P450